MTDLTTANLQQSLKKTSILLWTNANPKLPNTFILKDRENKRYLGLSRTDRKGQTYWSFREIKSSPESSPLMDNVAKFQQRQAKSKDYGKSNNNEQSN